MATIVCDIIAVIVYKHVIEHEDNNFDSKSNQC